MRLNRAVGSSRDLLSQAEHKKRNTKIKCALGGKVTEFSSLRQQRRSGLSPWVQEPSGSARVTASMRSDSGSHRYYFSDGGYRVLLTIKSTRIMAIGHTSSEITSPEWSVRSQEAGLWYIHPVIGPVKSPGIQSLSSQLWHSGSVSDSGFYCSRYC